MQSDDLLRGVTVADPAVGRGGVDVAVVVGTVDADANRGRSALWLVPVDGGSPRSLSDGTGSDSQPTFSPDGERIAFTRTVHRDDRSDTSILVVAADGSTTEPTVVATTPEHVRSLCWSADGARLAWCARVPEVDPATADRDRPARRITTLMNRLDDVGWTVDRRAQVHVAPADGSGPVRQVTSGPFDHDDVAWSPDGTTLAVVAARHDGWDLDEVSDLWLVDPEGCTPPGGSHEPRRLTDGTRRWSYPAWSPDGTRLVGLAAAVVIGWCNAKPVVVDVATGDETDVAPGIDRTFAPTVGDRPPVWEGDGAILTSHEEGGRVHLVRLRTDGSTDPEVIEGGDRWIAGFDARDGVIATVVTTASEPAELEVGGHRTSFTADFVAAVPPHPTTRFAVPSPAGDGDIDAWLVAPDGFDPDADPTESGGGRWPLLLSIHGGPMSQYGDRWFDEFQLLAGAGFVVVAANPHGSSGGDDAFQRAIRSPRAAVEPGTGWGGIDADDLLAVVDATLARWPSLDPARVGVLGGSYGGFMTTWLLGRSDRFAAGCSERAVNNLWSEEWSSDVGGSFHRELGVSHLSEGDEYLRMSPVTYAANITAPILLIHSEQDLRCPPEQADALFVALRLLGHPDVEYWRFPGEGHELSRSGSPRHRVQRAEIINAFFERTIGSGPR